MKLTTTLFTLELKHIRGITRQMLAPGQLVTAVAYAMAGWVVMSVLLRAIYLVIFPALLVTFLLFMLVLIWEFGTSRALTRLMGSQFKVSRIMEFDAEGFDTRLESGSHSRIVWQEIIRASHSQNVIFLLLGDFMFVPIPDTAWPTPKERDEFHDFLRTRNLLK